MMESPFKAHILKGKVALLTGGGSGIVIMGRRSHVLDSAVSSLRSEGISVLGLEGDVRKRDDAVNTLESTIMEFGKLDILVNAAACNFLVPAEDLSPNGFRTGLKNLKKGEPGKGPSTGGIIINISATLHYTASWYQIHISAVKAAVDSITRSLALEWGTGH